MNLSLFKLPDSAASVFYFRLFTAAVLLHACAAWFSEGYYHLDEHSQILNGVLIKISEGPEESAVWEHGNQFRSGFQPFIAYIIWSISPADGLPFTVAFITRLLSVMLSLAAVVVFWNACKAELQTENARRWALAAMLLPGVLIFYHARFSSEGWMSSFMLLGVGCLLAKRFAVSGIFFGLAFLCRYQAGFMLLPLAFYVVWQYGIKNALLAGAGGMAVLAAGFFIDLWYYGAPELPWLNYLKLHASADVDEGKSAWIYWNTAGLSVPLIGYVLPVVVVGFWFMFPRHMLTWITCLYVLFHLWTENRQVRFMLPVLVFTPLMFALIWERFIRHHAVIKKWFLRFLLLAVALNVPLALYAAFHPAKKVVKVLRECVKPHAGETVYFLNHGAVRSDMGIDFYLYGAPKVIPVNNEQELAELSGDTPALYISRKNRDDELRKNGIAFDYVCRALPKWLLKFDFNNWTKRASVFQVYEIKAVH